MGEYVSATQIETYRLCKRKWGFRRIDRVPTEPNASAQLGIDTHRQLEMYLRGGALDFSQSSGEIAASGLEHLPEPSPDNIIEREFSLEAPEVSYIGRIDLVIPGTPPTIVDHKTTKDLRWAKRPEDLAGDVQANLYAAWAMKEYDTDAVDLAWIYYTTRSPYRSRKVSLRMHQEHVAAEFEKIHSTALEMVGILSEGTRAIDLPPTPSACEAYGGCPYRFVCNLGPEERRHSIMSQASNDLLSRLRATVATPNGAAAMPAAPAMPAPIQAAPGQAYVPPAFAKPGEPTAPASLGAAQSTDQTTVTYQPSWVNAPEGPQPVPMPAEEKPKRGRKLAAVPVHSKIEAAKAETVLSAKQTEMRFEAAITPQKRIGTLYIDCYPSNGTKCLSDFLAAANLEVKKEYQVDDWRAVQYVSGAALCKALLAVMPVRTERLTVFSATAEANACLNILIAEADEVVR